MIWLAWRQFRTRALVAGARSSARPGLLVITRAHLAQVSGSRRHAVQALRRLQPGEDDVPGSRCQAPGLARRRGICGARSARHLLGSPLVAGDLEAGTYRVAWTQSVTRTRWVVTKLVVVGLATVAVAGVVAMSVTWWSSLFDRVNADEFSVFDARDVVPVAYAVVAPAPGVAHRLDRFDGRCRRWCSRSSGLWASAWPSTSGSDPDTWRRSGPFRPCRCRIRTVRRAAASTVSARRLDRLAADDQRRRTTCSAGSAVGFQRRVLGLNLAMVSASTSSRAAR